MKNKVGLFCGTFNPIHNGHLIMCSYILEHYDVDTIRLVVSPDSPFKKHKYLLPFQKRVLLCNTAVINDDRIKVSTVEDTLPKPAYTYQTLKYYKEKYGDVAEFILIMGADNLMRLAKFKNASYIFANFKVMICPRNGIDCNKYMDEICKKFKDTGVYGLEILESIPNVELSSTLIRNEVLEGKPIKYYVPEKIEKMIEKEYKV